MIFILIDSHCKLKNVDFIKKPKTGYLCKDNIDTYVNGVIESKIPLTDYDDFQKLTEITYTSGDKRDEFVLNFINKLMNYTDIEMDEFQVKLMEYINAVSNRDINEHLQRHFDTKSNHIQEFYTLIFKFFLKETLFNFDIIVETFSVSYEVATNVNKNSYIDDIIPIEITNNNSGDVTYNDIIMRYFMETINADTLRFSHFVKRNGTFLPFHFISLTAG
jgi:hypothetical protein